LQSYSEASPGAGVAITRAAGALDTIKKAVLIAVGTMAVVIGIVGIFVPVLPTTPFLLLAAACYAASSRRFYDWLMGNPVFGSYLRNYREGRGMSLKAKIGTLSLMWVMMGISMFFFIPSMAVKGILVLIALAVTAHIMTIRTIKG
jgi:uncharacterized protein